MKVRLVNKSTLTFEKLFTGDVFTLRESKFPRMKIDPVNGHNNVMLITGQTTSLSSDIPVSLLGRLDFSFGDEDETPSKVPPKGA